MFDLEKITRKNILELKPYSSARDEFKGAQGVFLDANENPYGPWNRYPDPQQKALKNKLARLFNQPAEQIFVGNGSDEVIDLVFRIFCQPGVDKVLTFTPTYGMYEVAAGINDITCLQLPLDADFEIDLDALDECLAREDRIKAIFICSPNNPTGNLLREKDIMTLLQRFEGIVVLDEAYMDFSEGTSWISRLSGYPNLVVSRTLSKAWGMAAARIGIALASPEIIGLMNKVKAPYNISALNQQAAIAALDNDAAYQKARNIIIVQKEKMIQALQALDLVQELYPSDANFLLVRFDNANEVYQKLIRKQIIVRNRDTVIPNCIRITIGTPEENDALLQALKEI